MATQDPKALIRSMPNASPDEVVKAAKKAGLSVEAGYVTRLRIIDKARGASANARKGSPKGVAKPAVPKKAAAKTARSPAKTGRPQSTGTPSDFIRSMPTATTVEIMNAAKKAGLKFSRGLVYMVRSKAGAKKGKPGRPPKSAGKPTRAEFVRSFGFDVKPAEIFERAGKAGVNLTLDYVYNIRKDAKKAAKTGKSVAKAPTASAPPKHGPGRPPKAAGGAPKRGPGRPPKPAATSSSLFGSERVSTAQVFRKLVLELGVGQAQQLVDEVARKLKAIVAG